MRDKGNIKVELNTWRYRFKSMGILGIVPIAICLLGVPFLFNAMLGGAGPYPEDTYTKTFWNMEIINIIMCVYWQMFLLEKHINPATREFFEHLDGGWKVKESVELYAIYMLVLSLGFGYVAYLSRNFILPEILWKDYMALACETIFVQGLFVMLAFKIKNTLLPMLAVFLLIIQQKQYILAGYEWLYFINGSIKNYGQEVFYVKYILGVVGIGMLILCNRKKWKMRSLKEDGYGLN